MAEEWFANGYGVTPESDSVCKHSARDEGQANVTPLPQEEEKTYAAEELPTDEVLPLGLIAGLIAARVGTSV